MPRKRLTARFPALSLMLGVPAVLAVLALNGEGGGDGGTSGEGGAPPPPPAGGTPPPSTGTPPAAGADDKGDDGKADTKTVTMSQAELDAAIASRIERDRRATATFLKAEADKAKLTESERAKAEAAERDAKTEERAKTLDDRDRRSAAREALNDAGVTNSKAVLALLDLSDVPIGADGEVDPKAIGKAIDKAKALAPELFAPAPKKGSSGAEFGGDSKHQYTREEIARMSPAEFAQNEAEIDRQVMAGTVK